MIAANTMVNIRNSGWKNGESFCASMLYEILNVVDPWFSKVR